NAWTSVQTRRAAMAGAAEHQLERFGHAQPEHSRSLRKVAYLTAGMGMAHALLFLLAFWLISDVPGPDASSQEILDYYTSDKNRQPSRGGLSGTRYAGSV